MIFRERAQGAVGPLPANGQSGIAGRLGLIDLQSDLTISAQTQLLSMSRGTVYYLPQANSQADLASRRVLAHKVAITLEACHAEEILQEAFSKYGTPESVNTDQGSQFTVEEFTSVVIAQGLDEIASSTTARNAASSVSTNGTASASGWVRHSFTASFSVQIKL